METEWNAGAVKVTAIHLAPGRRLPVKYVASVQAEAGKGLVGDRYHGSRHRHVTLQAQSDLDLAAADLGYAFQPGDTRRNITVDAGPVPTRPGERLRIGEVELEVVRIAAPCKIMEDAVGPGATAALRRRAGTCFRVLTSGTISVGDGVEVATAPTKP